MEDKLSKIGLAVALSLMLAVTLAMTTAAAPRAEAQNASDTDHASLVNLYGQYKSIGVFLTWYGLDIPDGYDLVANRGHMSGPCPCENATVTILSDVRSGQPVAALDKQPVSGTTYVYWLTLTPNRPDIAPGDLGASKTLSYYVSPKPHTLRATAVSGQGVMLNWTAGAHPKYTKQIVRRRPAGSATWTDIEIGARDDRYTDRTAKPGVKYSYRVKAAKATGKGGQTNRVKITAP